MNQHFQTFKLLTGRTPFDSKGSMSDRIAEMRTVLQDEVPEPWLNDSERKEYDETTGGLVASIEKSVSESLHKDEAAAAASFIKSCLRLDPEKRLTAAACSAHKWLSEANACSCLFC
jgi:serine/threonine-protein kinase SRPK3